ncbi:hypothetical protein [Pandoraea apista]|uniref:Uncharacterized protein n=1 Tax=Pandoraea apista TaxID=93218 RepID=A0ABX9ZVS6_9BURK|nr:hypothetical protein [Pandoraea apista]AVF40473.1 hypothetical protein AL486_12710 [Pandoraea apista]PTE03018.1 hypothetical protein C7830_02090 [Pandoraea apista]RRJ35170.1 hypothetical protein EIB05_00555 [Pandoraea apista]RRJ81589.1 hypothetical protein EIL82_02725 [Pandoraea apista]RSD10090.1 hypothetical protein EJB12_14385 [Pandoraea apista]
MRILTNEMQYRVRQGVSALSAAIVVTLGLCAVPAQAQDVSRSPLMHLAMLTGSMMPASFGTTALPVTSISDADGSVLPPVAAQAPADETPAIANRDEGNGASDSGMPLAARIDDEQLGSQRGRNLQGGAMVKSPGMALANGVTLWDELPGAVTPTPRPQQLSNGVNNLQVTRVTYTTR